MCERKEHFPTKYGLQDVSGIGGLPSAGSHTQESGNLIVISLTPEQHAKTCGYWYLVQTSCCTPHTAFRLREHLLTWLEDRGLTLTGELALAPEHSVVTVTGRYRRTSHLSYDAFFSLDGKRVRLMDNGDYTLGIITHDEDGVANVHHLNCNMRDRPIFDHEASRQAVG